MKKILIIDDDKRNVFALEAVLKAKKIECETARSAREGIEKLSTNEHIGLVLMDIMMPEMDGYEAIAAIRKDEKLKNIPIIAVTANAMSGDKEQCLQAGADDYISKPVDVNALLKRIDKLLKDVF